MACPFLSLPQGPVAMGSAPLSAPGTWGSSRMSTLGLAFPCRPAGALPPSADATHRLEFFLSKGDAYIETGPDSTWTYTWLTSLHKAHRNPP